MNGSKPEMAVTKPLKRTKLYLIGFLAVIIALILSGVIVDSAIQNSDDKFFSMQMAFNSPVDPTVPGDDDRYEWSRRFPSFGISVHTAFSIVVSLQQSFV